MAIHDDIKRLLKRLKLRQVEVANTLGMSQSRVSDMLSGKSQITGSFLESLADMLDMSVLELFASASGEDPKESYKGKALAAKKTLLRIAGEETVGEAPIEFTLKLYTNLMTGAYSDETVRELLSTYKLGQSYKS